MTDILAEPLTLPCGAVIPNRLAKAAMTEAGRACCCRATSRWTRITWSVRATW
jgi:hypothetical protein